MPDIGEDLGRAPFWGMEDEADAEFVSGALEAESNHCD